MNTFINRISNTHPLSKNSWKELNKLLEIKTYPANYKLVKYGKVTTKAYFLLNGIARSYFISKNGKEVNSTLYADKSFVAAYACLIMGTPALTPIETLTECRFIECDYKDFIKLTDKYIDLNILHRKNLESFFITLQNKDLDLANLNSTERYLKLIEKIPKLETLITQKNIALHLGISQVQLSRLKKRLYSNK